MATIKFNLETVADNIVSRLAENYNGDYLAMSANYRDDVDAWVWRNVKRGRPEYVRALGSLVHWRIATYCKR
jgi:hypothetical protein